MPLLGRSTAHWIIQSGPEAHSRRSRACFIKICALGLDAAPGSMPSSCVPVLFCEPGLRESTVQIRNAFPAATPNAATASFAQPACNGRRAVAVPAGRLRPVRCAAACAAPRIEICSSRNTCLNPEYLQDCGNGTICSKGSACKQPTGGVFAAGERRANSRIAADRARATADWQVAPLVVV